MCSRLVFVSVSQSVVNADKFSERSILAPCPGAMISLVCILAAVLDSLAQHPLSERRHGSRKPTRRLATPKLLKQRLQRGMQCSSVWQ